MVIPDINEFLRTYGYWAVLIGTFFEGETILALAGIAAHARTMKLSLVILAGIIGSMTGDQLWFLVGRLQGQALLDRRPGWQRRVERVRQSLERHQTWFIIGFRFFYGLRSVSPFVIGMTRIRVMRFLLLNAIGAVIWSAALASISFAFGHVVLAYVHGFKHTVLVIVGVLLVLILVATLIMWMRHVARLRALVGEDHPPGGEPPPGDGPGAAPTTPDPPPATRADELPAAPPATTMRHQHAQETHHD